MYCTQNRFVFQFPKVRFQSNFAYASDFPFLTELNVESNQLSGNVSWSELPSALRVLNVRKNKLSGSVEWNSLPSCLMILDISENKFTGSCELDSLPPALRELNASQNSFDGELRLENIPFALVTLNLSSNKLAGEVNFSGIRRECHSFSVSVKTSGESEAVKCPVMLQELDLSKNCFHGNFTFDLFLSHLLKLDMSSNSIGPSVVVENLAPSMVIDLRLNRISAASLVNCINGIQLFPQRS